jgi:uncharacterized membrane protein YqaE (UPF0057 family)
MEDIPGRFPESEPSRKNGSPPAFPRFSANPVHDSPEPRSFVMASEGGKDFVRIVLSLIIPPIGVFFQVGIGLHFWLNILLTLFGYVPGLLHAIYIIVRKD